MLNFNKSTRIVIIIIILMLKVILNNFIIETLLLYNYCNHAIEVEVSKEGVEDEREKSHLLLQ